MKLLSTTKENFEDLPQGFRVSSLGASYKAGNGHPLQFLTPELNSTGLAFKDLHLGKKQAVCLSLLNDTDTQTDSQMQFGFFHH